MILIELFDSWTFLNFPRCSLKEPRFYNSFFGRIMIYYHSLSFLWYKKWLIKLIDSKASRKQTIVLQTSNESWNGRLRGGIKKFLKWQQNIVCLFVKLLCRSLRNIHVHFTITGRPCSTWVTNKNLAESSMNQRNDIFLSVSVTFTGRLFSPLPRRYLEIHCTSDGSRELCDKYFTRW